MENLSRACGRSFLSPTLLTLMLCLGGCATAGKGSGTAVPETGPSRTAASGPAADEDSESHACSAPASSPRGSCGGCSVSCGDKQAFCRAGEEWPSGGPSCRQPALCTCR